MSSLLCVISYLWCFFFQAEDGIRDLVRARGLGDVYKRQDPDLAAREPTAPPAPREVRAPSIRRGAARRASDSCLLYTSDAADERSRVDLGGRRILQKKTSGTSHTHVARIVSHQGRTITHKSSRGHEQET